MAVISECKAQVWSKLQRYRFLVAHGKILILSLKTLFIKNAPSLCAIRYQTTLYSLCFREPIVSEYNSRRLSVRSFQTPSKRRTDRRRESNLAHFCLNMRHLVAIILMNFPIINWPNFVYLLVDPVFYPPPPLNFFEASRFVLPHRMDPRDRHNEQTNERTDGRRDASVRPSVRPSVS